MESGAPGTILLTGATGYIGGRLLPLLLAMGRRMRLLVRDRTRLRGIDTAGAEVVTWNLQHPDMQASALRGVDTAYYLVHSMATSGDLESEDRLAAEHFAEASRAAGVRRISYLGGPGQERDRLSPHLRSRQEVDEWLRVDGVPVIEFGRQ